MQYYPKRQNKHALIAVVLLYLLAAICTVGSSAAQIYPALWQLLGVGAAMAAIMLTNRFLLCNYLYVLTPPENLHVSNCFSVVRVLGKRRKLVAKLDLGSVHTVLPEKNLKQTLKVLGCRPTTRASFCVDMFADPCWALIAESGTQCIVVLLQCDESFIKELKTRIPPKE